MNPNDEVAENRLPLLSAPWNERRSGTPLVRPDDSRPWFHRDRARLIHSAAFRRLQAKTQALGVGEGDFHRTRLTHSLEVAQIAQGITHCLAVATSQRGNEDHAILPDPTLIEAIALAHDLGHPPFGHGGETALNRCMRDFGGFEGNGQTLRLVCRLEAHSDAFGLDLARRTLLGVLKYPLPYDAVNVRAGDVDESGLDPAVRWRPPKCFYDEESDVVGWILAPFAAADRARFQSVAAQADPAGRAVHRRPGYKGFDTTILELADDIAYGVHDLEDGIALRLIVPDKLMAVWADHRAAVARYRAAPSDPDMRALFADASARKRAVGTLVHFFIVNVAIERHGAFEHPLLDAQARLPADIMRFLRSLMALVRQEIIELPVVQMLEFRGQYMVRRIFETVAADPERLLDRGWLPAWRAAAVERGRMRAVADYVATLTDESATRVYERMYVPRARNAFDRD